MHTYIDRYMHTYTHKYIHAHMHICRRYTVRRSCCAVSNAASVKGTLMSRVMVGPGAAGSGVVHTAGAGAVWVQA